MRKLRSSFVGIDFSDSSWVALGHAARIARWSGAGLHAANESATLVHGDIVVLGTRGLRRPARTMQARPSR
jgi:nucleotide-binding universal stress UspA family protein